MSSRALTFFLLVAFQSTVFSACTDGTNNVLMMADVGNQNLIQLDDGLGQAYDSNFNPSCYRNVGNLKIPGVLNLISGTLTVRQKLQIIGNSKIILTLKTKTKAIGTICLNGTSTNSLVPDSFCTIDLCPTGNALCNALEQPGVHKLKELEGGSNGTFILPAFPDPIRSLAVGQWRIGIKLVVGGDTVALHTKVPGNEDAFWIWVNQ